jgi:uncharacterized membrane protein YhaH (DUF805 family)
VQKQIRKQVSRRRKFLLVYAPLFLGAFIIFSNEASYWISTAHQPIKGGAMTIVFSFIGQGFHLIPFIMIARVTDSLINRGSQRMEIYLKLSCMLIPVASLTTYSCSLIDPLAQMFLLILNIVLVQIGLIVGAAASKLFTQNQPE